MRIDLDKSSEFKLKSGDLVKVLSGDKILYLFYHSDGDSDHLFDIHGDAHYEANSEILEYISSEYQCIILEIIPNEQLLLTRIK